MRLSMNGLSRLETSILKYIFLLLSAGRAGLGLGISVRDGSRERYFDEQFRELWAYYYALGAVTMSLPAKRMHRFPSEVLNHWS
jgi:hypothetical protein